MNKIYFFFIICLFGSCTNYSTEIEDVLKQAGKNRSELEKVLKHYNHNPADSLKLRAAAFLITNMPGKYSRYYDAPWNDVATVSLRWTSSSDKQKVLDAYGLEKPVVREDVKYITADFLINNIDLAFKVWQEQPWGKHITFDIFCEEILPYRVSTEKLENWREKALASYADIYRSLQKQPNITAVEACCIVNDLLPTFRIDIDFPAMNYSMLMASTRGTCSNIAALTVFVMRALGIPVTIDYTPNWPDNTIGHSWNAVCDSTGKHISFAGKETNPGGSHQGNNKLKPKAYRQTFRTQNNITDNITNIPPTLRNKFFKDVSSEYNVFVDVDIPVKTTYAQLPQYAYLAIMGKLEWVPVCWGMLTNGQYHFEKVGCEIGYLPFFYENGQQVPFNNPFLLYDDSVFYWENYDVKESNTANTVAVDNIKSISGLWKFEDAKNIGKATVGKDLIAYKMSEDSSIGAPSTIGFETIEGIKAGNKAVRIPKQGYFKCFPGIAHKGTGNNINAYTILIDFSLPVKNISYCFFQTNPNNKDNTDLFLRPNMLQIGIDNSYAFLNPALQENKWYRLVISAQLGKSLKYYMNGTPIYVNYNKNDGMTDSRFTLSKESILFFADDDGEDNTIDVSQVAVYSKALSDEEVLSLGGAENK